MDRVEYLVPIDEGRVRGGGAPRVGVDGHGGRRSDIPITRPRAGGMVVEGCVDPLDVAVVELGEPRPRNRSTARELITFTAVPVRCELVAIPSRALRVSGRICIY